MPALNFQKQFADDVKFGRKCQTIRAHRKDGFRDWFALTEWFETIHGLPFDGALIEWRI